MKAPPGERKGPAITRPGLSRSHLAASEAGPTLPRGTRIYLEADREWTVVVIDRPRRVRRFYLDDSERAYLAQLLAKDGAR